MLINNAMHYAFNSCLFWKTLLYWWGCIYKKAFVSANRWKSMQVWANKVTAAENFADLLPFSKRFEIMELYHFTVQLYRHFFVRWKKVANSTFYFFKIAYCMSAFSYLCCNTKIKFKGKIFIFVDDTEPRVRYI